MLYRSFLKSFQYSTLTAALLIFLAPLTHATDSGVESQAPNTQPQPSQAPQQATPAQPAVEPVDEDGGTALA